MRKFVLVAGDGWKQSDQDAVSVFWRGRAVGSGAISLERELDRRLPEIRREHMVWAWEMGGMEFKNGQTLETLLEGGQQPSMWWTSLIYERHPRLSPHLYPIYKLRCLELLLAEYGCASVHLHGGDPLLARTLEKLCGKMNIAFTMDKSRSGRGPAKNAIQKIYGRIPAPLRTLTRYAHWWWTVKRKLPFCSSLPAPGRCLEGGRKEDSSATVATYFPNIDLHEAAQGQFRSRYWESLHTLLNDEACRERPAGQHFVRWIFIRFPAPGLTLEQCISLRDKFASEGRDGLSFNYLEEFLSTGDLARAFWRWLRIAFASLFLPISKYFHFKNSKLDFWPYMRHEWAESFRGWRCLERCLQNTAFRRYFMLAGVQRWTLFPLENCPWERMLTVAARRIKGNGPVFGTQHSTIRPTDFRYFDYWRTFFDRCAVFQPDSICGNGSSACRQWSENRMPTGRLGEVEALRYLYLLKLLEKASVNSHEQAPLPVQAGEPKLPAACRKLLVLTSFFAEETDAVLDVIGQGLEDGIFENWQIVLKPHPLLGVQEWLARLAPPLRENIFLAEGPLENELKPGVSVLAANSTTAALEAAILGLPVMVMSPMDDFDLCPIQNVEGLARIADVNDLKHYLPLLKPLRLPDDYLDLNPLLPGWRKLLNLSDDKK